MNQPIQEEAVGLPITSLMSPVFSPTVRIAEKNVHCTEDTEETKEIEENEEGDETKEKEEKEESEDLEEIDQLPAELWEEIDTAISECGVGNDKKTYRPLFNLARKVMGLTGKIGKRLSVGLATEITCRWHLTNSANLDVDNDYSVEFLAKLSQVSSPFGQQLAEALELARKQSPPKKTQDFPSEIQLLASLCRELQRRTEEEPFFLDCRSAANLLGKSPTTICTWLKALTYIGVIRLDEKGYRGHASRYYYVASD